MPKVQKITLGFGEVMICKSFIAADYEVAMAALIGVSNFLRWLQICTKGPVCNC
jgi:hypothetical protein